MLAGRDIRTRCLHEAVHITIALWRGLDVLSASVEVGADGFLEGVRLDSFSVDDESSVRPSLALFYLAPSIYERQILCLDEISVSYGSSEDYINFEGQLTLMSVDIAQGYDEYSSAAMAIFENPLTLQCIESFASALESSSKLSRSEIYEIWRQFDED